MILRKELSVENRNKEILDMTVDEVRAIKEKMSLETAGMSVSELHSFYSNGATEIQRKIDAIRAGNQPIKKGFTASSPPNRSLINLFLR